MKEKYSSLETISNLLSISKQSSFENYDTAVAAYSLGCSHLPDTHKLRKLYVEGIESFIENTSELDQSIPPHLKNLFKEYFSIYDELKTALEKADIKDSDDEYKAIEDIDGVYQQLINSITSKIQMVDDSQESKNKVAKYIENEKTRLDLCKDPKATAYRNILSECANSLNTADVSTREGRSMVKAILEDYGPVFEEYHKAIFNEKQSAFADESIEELSEMTILFYFPFRK